MSNVFFDHPIFHSPYEVPRRHRMMDETGEISIEAWASLYHGTSCLFDKPKNGGIAVRVINHLGDDVMTMFRA